MENWKFGKKAKLLNIYKELLAVNKRKLIAYTDGSLIENKMGFGWSIWNENKKEKLFSFKGGNRGFPSSTKAELMAILTVLIVVPNETEIEIKMNSLNAINTIEKFESITSLRKLLKLKNYWILKNIKTIKNILELKWKFTKVKTHDSIIGNKEVDLLAKEGTK